MYGIRFISYDLLAWDAVEEYLMGENKDSEINIWGSDTCPECESIKKYYSSIGYNYNDVSELVSGEKADVDAMVQLSFQNMRLPLIQVDGNWVDPKDLKEKMNAKAA